MDEFAVVTEILLRFASRSSVLCESVRSFVLALVGHCPILPKSENSKMLVQLANMLDLSASTCSNVIGFVCESRYASCIFWDACELHLKATNSDNIDGFDMITSSFCREETLSRLCDPSLDSKDYLYSAQRAIRADTPSPSTIQSCFIHDRDSYVGKKLPMLKRTDPPRDALLRELEYLKSKIANDEATLRKLEVQS